MNKISELLNIEINKPFNIKGQNMSNPYTLLEDGYAGNIAFTFLANKYGEEVSSWVICNLINGQLVIE